MTEAQAVCLLNDSFPPIIDGVSNAVLSYANNLHQAGKRAIVITPSHPEAEDTGFPYPVIRYPSLNFRKMDGYVAGVPFSPETARNLAGEQVALLHSHCPIMSTFLARELRQIKKAPIVLTYHTKFDVDIENVVKNQKLQDTCKKALVSNISACDEVWVVSKGAGENLRQLGYEGDYIIMPNGVDLPHERVPDMVANCVAGSAGIPSEMPVFLFVGRMMWYKGIRIILDALSMLKKNGKVFRMVFVGDGADRAEIERYAEMCGLGDVCLFTGAIHNREILRGWYCRADLFLFPSTFDTNGLVVGEAAANDLASVLIKDSCAAENVSDGINGFLIEENAQALFALLDRIYGKRKFLRAVGAAAGRDLYVSWSDAVKMASARYEVVIERYLGGDCIRNKNPMDGVMKINGELMKTLAKLSEFRRNRPLK